MLAKLVRDTDGEQVGELSQGDEAVEMKVPIVLGCEGEDMPGNEVVDMLVWGLCWSRTLIVGSIGSSSCLSDLICSPR